MSKFKTKVEQPVEETRPLPQGVRRLTITVNGKEPLYRWEGDWNGHDVNYVMRFTRRAYLLRNRSIRREQAKEIK